MIGGVEVIGVVLWYKVVGYNRFMGGNNGGRCVGILRIGIEG